MTQGDNSERIAGIRSQKDSKRTNLMTYSFDILPFFCSPFAIAHPFCVFTTEVADSPFQLNLFHEFIKTWIETLDKIDIAIKAMKRAEDILCLFARSLSPSWNPSSTLSKFSHPTAPFSGTIFYLGANRILHITLFLRPSFCLYFCPICLYLCRWAPDGPLAFFFFRVKLHVILSHRECCPTPP